MRRPPRLVCETCGREIASPQMGRHQLVHENPRALLWATDDEIERVVELYRRHSIAEVAEITQWSAMAVQRMLVVAGVERRARSVTMHPRRTSGDVLLQVAQMYGRGLTMDEIAERMGCSRSTIHRRLRVAGAVIRSRGDGQRRKARSTSRELA